MMHAVENHSLSFKSVVSCAPMKWFVFRYNWSRRYVNNLFFLSYVNLNLLNYQNKKPGKKKRRGYKRNGFRLILAVIIQVISTMYETYQNPDLSSSLVVESPEEGLPSLVSRPESISVKETKNKNRKKD